MKQYCRYCNYCTAEEICVEYNKSVNARVINKCPRFSYNAIDALMSEDKNGEIHQYKSREPKKKQCDGQISLFGKE